MFWVATEDADTCEVTEFEKAEEMEVLYLMDGYKVDTSNPEKFRMQDTENGKNIIYEVVTYRGCFGYNLWVARKFVEL